ncbi:hypothetical protein [Nitrospira sp. Ecomares 2.1]
MVADVMLAVAGDVVVVIGVAFWGIRPSHKASLAPSFFLPILVDAEFVRCSPFQFDR